MKKKNSLILDDEFIKYCEINGIDNIEKLAKDTFNRGFTLLKYGEVPMGIKDKVNEKEIIKEIIKEVEVIKEVPVEKIVEVIKEVQVKGETNTIVKEVIVENNEELNKLKIENKKLKDDLDKISKSLDSFNKAKFLKNSNLSSLYGE
jgi:regulator of RNase E activity RraB